MKIIFIALICLGFGPAHATDADEIQNCLKHWKAHPFSRKDPDFRVITSKVKVLGIGGNVENETATDKPELILIKPNVSVLSHATLNLSNPNGWYCLKGKVAVLGKTEINLNCKAHLAASNDGATVMGSDTNETGVTVLGSSRVNRTGCVK